MISITDILGWLMFAMLLLRLMVVVSNYLSRPYLAESLAKTEFPKVSILIPARDEVNTLPYLLSDLTNILYPNVEVIVCNDHSTDGTLDILQEFEDQLANLLYFTNEKLPSGWSGKNYACYQLTKKASGDYYLFLDADVRLSPDSINRAVNHAQKYHLDLLSLFPHQIIQTPGEWSTVPLMNWILLTMLPLSCVRLPWFSSLSAANGQFMLFEAKNYLKYQWHQKVWNKSVEDIHIARIMKKEKRKVAVLTGTNDVMCRMYQSREDAVTGFSRNIHQYFGGSRMWMTLFLLLTIFRLPLFALFQQWWLLLFGVIFIVVMKILVAQMSHQPILKSFQYHYHQLAALVSLVFRNLVSGITGEVEWKGRVYKG